MISLCRLVSPRVNRTGNSDDPTLIAACRPGVAPLQCWPDGKAGSATRNVNGLTRCVRGRCPEVALLAMGEEVTEARPPPVRFRAKHVSIGESGQWLSTSSIPKLFIDGDPGGFLVGGPRDFCRT